ncbi:MAG: SUF system NifU family Fe-S cluster assembly protein [bacterium]|nr:SUF system NifU family Fe-S cluster assembly protein [bacterium]
MDDLRDLYQEMILDHYKNPRNFHIMEGANRRAEGYNPLCGDRVTVYLLIENDTITDVSFEGSGCAICTASTSVMTELLKGQSFEEAEALFASFRGLVTADPSATVENMGKLAAFTGVREFPVRIKCATLPWHTMLSALENKHEPVTTE